jgi:hypothetical protein
MAGVDQEATLRTTNATLTQKVLDQAEQIEAKDEAIKRALALVGRCYASLELDKLRQCLEQALKGGEDETPHS